MSIVFRDVVSVPVRCKVYFGRGEQVINFIYPLFPLRFFSIGINFVCVLIEVITERSKDLAIVAQV